MLKNRWLLASVVFIVSFVLSLVSNRDIKIAIGTGIIAVFANFCGIFIANGVQRMQQRRIINILEREIRDLEDFGIELYDYISAMAEEQQRREINLSNLQRQLNQVYIQNAEQQRSKSQLNQELVNLREQRQNLEAEVQQWEKQVYHLEQRREELDLCLRSLASEKHNTEVSLINLRDKIEQLQQEINQFTSQPKPTFEIVKTVEIVASVVEEKAAVLLPDEWVEFICQLTPSEVQVLKAIAHQENPNPTIKKIAETYITMPELLIDGINQQAIATIGDIIIEPGSNPPVIAEDEYLTKIKEILKINE